MTLTEWTDLTKTSPTESEWEIISLVYTFHPAIPDVGGKKVLADLYKVGGFGLISGMLVAAESAEKLDREVREAESAIERKKAEIESETLRLRDELYSLKGELSAKQEERKSFNQSFQPKQ